MQRELLVAIQAATSAGQLLKRHFREPIEVRYKGEIDPVTSLDFKSESLIAGILRGELPDYSILGEESYDEYREDRPCWIVDPLDGTTNYSRGCSMFAVSIALRREGQTALGVVFSPVLDELFIAVNGGGAMLNWKPTRVSSTEELGRAVLASGFPYDIRSTDQDNLDLWARLTRRIFSPRCDGCASLDLCYVAAGRYDGYWELDLESWDMAAGALIVAEAGGKVTKHNGEPFDPFDRSILAASPGVYQEVLQQLSSVPKSLGG